MHIRVHFANVLQTAEVVKLHFAIILAFSAQFLLLLREEIA